MSVTYLLIGGNQGDRLKYLRSAVNMISQETGKIIRMSSVYETEPFGFQDKNQFLNICIMVETDLSPYGTLENVSDIENSLGRNRKPDKYVSRNIDIDILFYDDLIINNPSLTIPHPEIHNRNFALVPMAEISPEYIHPVIGKTILSLLKESTDKHNVVRFQDPFSW
jgi:2-amino-4-hydroxy-6-hydroxymethyldihydropteridine diphosphokinase